MSYEKKRRKVHIKMVTVEFSKIVVQNVVVIPRFISCGYMGGKGHAGV